MVPLAFGALSPVGQRGMAGSTSPFALHPCYPVGPPLPHHSGASPIGGSTAPHAPHWLGAGSDPRCSRTDAWDTTVGRTTLELALAAVDVLDIPAPPTLEDSVHAAPTTPRAAGLGADKAPVASTAATFMATSSPMANNNSFTPSFWSTPTSAAVPTPQTWLGSLRRPLLPMVLP